MDNFKFGRNNYNGTYSYTVTNRDELFQIITDAISHTDWSMKYLLQMSDDEKVSYERFIREKIKYG